MSKTTIVLLALLFLLFPKPAEQDTQYLPPPEACHMGQSKAELLVCANYVAAKYQISSKDLKDTITGESQWNPSAIGDGGASVGMCQIHLRSHPSVSREQALDPNWCLDWTAHQFSLGNARMWTAYRNLKQ